MHRLGWACVPLTLMASAGIVAQTSSPLTSAAREGTLVTTGVSIVDAVRGTTSAPQDVVVEGGRIAAIAADGKPTGAEGARRVDGTGRFAIPGLSMFMRTSAKGGSVRRTTRRVRVRFGSSSDMA
jgi:hypothetical protein